MKTIVEVFDRLAEAVRHADPLPWVLLEEGLYQTPQGAHLSLRVEDAHFVFSWQDHPFAVIPYQDGDPLQHLQEMGQYQARLKALENSLMRQLILQAAPSGWWICHFNKKTSAAELSFKTDTTRIQRPDLHLPWTHVSQVLQSCVPEDLLPLTEGISNTPYVRFQGHPTLFFFLPSSSHERLQWLAQEHIYLF